MPSTAIRNIAYDATLRALTVTFVTGRRYVYADVDQEVFAEFTAAPSKGTYFNAEIRDAYEYCELKRS